jgi:hypothetical protein
VLGCDHFSRSEEEVSRTKLFPLLSDVLSGLDWRGETDQSSAEQIGGQNIFHLDDGVEGAGGEDRPGHDLPAAVLRGRTGRWRRFSGQNPTQDWKEDRRMGGRIGETLRVHGKTVHRRIVFEGMGQHGMNVLLGGLADACEERARVVLLRWLQAHSVCGVASRRSSFSRFG